MLEGDRQIHLRAHAYAEEGTDLVFSMLMKGRPAFYMDVFRIPRAVVTDVVGG